MAKVDIISGFLGAGKTTLIKKLLKDGGLGENVVLIENEFGEIGIDGGFLKEAGVQITEMNSGCICCTLVGDFAVALKQVVEDYNPDRIIIEPSGVGKLSDVIKAVDDIEDERILLNSFTAVVDATKAKIYLKNFGEFFNNQVQYARTVILSRTQMISEEKLNQVIAMLKELNKDATIITTPWDDLDGEVILKAMETKSSFEDELLADAVEIARKHQEEHAHHHHHDDDDEHEHEHGHCHHHDEDDEHEHEHGHCHHHDEDDEHEHGHCCHHHDDDDEHEHHHEHDHDHEHEHGEECSCGCHGHHHHHADEVFDSWGYEGPAKFEREKLDEILETLAEGDDYGYILRAKGMVPASDGSWLFFDLTPGEYEIRDGSAEVTGKLCVIGSKLKKEELKELFGV